MVNLNLLLIVFIRLGFYFIYYIWYSFEIFVNFKINIIMIIIFFIIYYIWLDCIDMCFFRDFFIKDN